MVSFVTSRQRSILGDDLVLVADLGEDPGIGREPGLAAALAAQLRAPSKRTSPSCCGEPIVNSRPASAQISACRDSAWPASCSEIAASLAGVELDALALHAGEHLDQRHLDLAHHPLEAEVGELRALAGGQLPGQAGGLRRIAGPARLLLSERELPVVGGLGVASAHRDPLVGGELVELVGPPRRVDQVGGDHRVVGEVERPGGEVGRAARAASARRST